MTEISVDMKKKKKGPMYFETDYRSMDENDLPVGTVVKTYHALRAEEDSETISSTVAPEVSIDISTCAIEFENVSFAYSNSTQILDRISFKIPRDRKTALVGRSHTGKSTIIRLIFGLLKPTNPEAKIRIFGQDIRLIPREKLYSMMSLVRQFLEFFKDSSLKYNVLYGRAADKVLWQLGRREKMKQSGTQQEDKHSLDEKNNDEGYMRIIRAADLEHLHGRVNCHNLSGGEQQQLGIARILERQSEIVIYDEPTSQLDSEAERRVLDKIKQLMPDSTSFMVAHRLSTIRDADQILVLDRGRNGSQIVDKGTHSELLERSGVYANLWRHQM
jgi:ABC-type multidrug transport system fused ATPase/permease subunit